MNAGDRCLRIGCLEFRPYTLRCDMSAWTRAPSRAHRALLNGFLNLRQHVGGKHSRPGRQVGATPAAVLFNIL